MTDASFCEEITRQAVRSRCLLSNCVQLSEDEAQVGQEAPY